MNNFQHFIACREEYETFFKKLISEMPNLPEGTTNIVIALQSVVSRHFFTVTESERNAAVIIDLSLYILFN